MVYCTKCGAEQIDSAKFCTQCGAKMPLLTNSDNEYTDSLERKIEKKAEEFGKKAEQIGNRIENKAEKIGNHFNHWYDKKFGILGPLIGAFIVLIVIRIIIFFIQAIGDDVFIITSLGEGLYEYLLIIFISILISNYNTYLNRKYHQQYQFIYPFIGAIGFIIGFWVLAQILLIIDNGNNTLIIASIGGFIITYIYVFFVLAILIGYISQFASGHRFYDKK